ncbi:hypothetical protein E2C01_080139 [Portunus trituberculatus]|uniref:Uncharacterized protein n=1 Tax=Portunus trituberculatus TaxID=210409 RepID=A0A5B7IXL8_PORTR|nr:hypothetical protein [Portunus trituberculatus]
MAAAAAAAAAAGHHKSESATWHNTLTLRCEGAGLAGYICHAQTLSSAAPRTRDLLYPFSPRTFRQIFLAALTSLVTDTNLNNCTVLMELPSIVQKVTEGLLAPIDLQDLASLLPLLCSICILITSIIGKDGIEESLSPLTKYLGRNSLCVAIPVICFIILVHCEGASYSMHDTVFISSISCVNVRVNLSRCGSLSISGCQCDLFHCTRVVQLHHIQRTLRCFPRHLSTYLVSICVQVDLNRIEGEASLSFLYSRIVSIISILCQYLSVFTIWKPPHNTQPRRWTACWGEGLPGHGELKGRRRRRRRRRRAWRCLRKAKRLG